MSDIPVSTSSAPSIERPGELSPYKRWRVEIEMAEKELQKFHQRGEDVNRRFVDERDAFNSSKKWFNVFYANTNILESAIYAQMPKPTVNRKFIDYRDDVARVAAIILQRNIEPDVDDPRDTFDAVMRHSVQDRLVPGLAVAWLRLETDTEEDKEVPSEPGDDYDTPNAPHNGFKTGLFLDPPQPEAPSQQPQPGGAPGMASSEGELGSAEAQLETGAEKFLRITDQRVCVDYVYWKDFLWSPCRVWEERRWTGRRCYLDRDELIERFGKDKGGKVPLDFRPKGLNGSNLSTEPRHEAIEKAVIYEIWDRMDRKIMWLSKSWPELLDESDDFLELSGFEPHPKPMFANISTSNTVPRPDYYMIQDQYQELNEVNNRISMLIKACKVVGVYAKNQIGIQRMLQEGFDNQLIPVDEWAAFAEKGGVKGQIDWLPLDQVIQALQRLYEQREAIKGQIYELTGIADIVRGASKASETLGAQQIKAQFASVRIKKLQDEVGRYASDLLRLKAEIIVKHVEPELIIAKSNIMRTDDAYLASAAMELLLSETGFEWRINVSSDAMGQTDYALEKQERTELFGTVSGFIEKAMPFLNDPKWGPMLISMLKWTISGYKNSDELEGILDKMIDSIQRMPPPPPPPNPDMVKAQIAQQQGQQKMQIAGQQHQLKLAGLQADLQAKQASNNEDLRAKQVKNQLDAAADQRAQQIDVGGKLMEELFQVKKYRLDRASDAAALAHELRTSNLQHATALRKSNLEIRTAERAAEAAGAKSRANATARSLRKPSNGARA